MITIGALFETIVELCSSEGCVRLGMLTIQKEEKANGRKDREQDTIKSDHKWDDSAEETRRKMPEEEKANEEETGN